MWPSLLILLSVPTIDQSTVPAAGTHRAHVQIDAFGRYAVTATSKQGVALQLVDKAAGPGPIVERIDAFLDRGTYRIITHGDPKNEGDAKLTVHPYRELSGSAPPALVELKPIDLTLGDFEQRSYWIDLTAAKTVVLEAAGRNLTDLRLWKDGSWLVDATPSRDTTEPHVGRPLTVFRMVATLEPGLYLVTAYGGPPNAWAEDDGRHPFHLRYGIPPLPTALRRRYQVGPFGYDRYVVRGANYFRLELAEARPLSLDLRAWTDAQPFSSYTSASAAITKSTVPPVAELDTGSEGAWVVTVTGAEGEPYLLQHFRSLWYTALPTPSVEYFVSTVHAGHAEDSIDATGIVVDSGALHRARAWQAVPLSGALAWGRRFNLLEEATVFLDIKEAGKYRITGGGGAVAGYRVEPFLIDRPRDYQTPPFRASGADFDLDRGLFVLTISPEKKGILEVTMAKPGSLFSSFKALVTGQKEGKLPRGQLRFNAFAASGHYLYLSRQPGVRAGVIARPLPLDLREALPVTQAPEEELELAATIVEEGLLIAEAEDGSRLDLSVDGDGWSKSARPSLGVHRVKVRVSGEHLVSYSLSLAPKRFEPDTPLPPLPDGRLAGLPRFPVLEEGEPRYLDLERDSAASFMLRAASPALFRVESTGLLATEGNLRTRMVTSTLRAEQNGVGRNFLVQQYLGTGDYQITIRTRGRTKGHLGLRLKRTAADQGGRLALDIPARATVSAGHTISYPFQIVKAGQYRLRAIGRDRTLRCRLEDADGWPLVEPNVEASFERWFEPGQYRLLVMPELVDVRVVALLEKLDPPQTFSGHGPHRIRLDQTVEHTWNESTAGPKAKPGARHPDVWVIQVPAAIEAAVSLSGKMHGDLIRIGKDGARDKVAYVPPLRGWSGALSTGEHRLEVMNLHQSSGEPYTVAVRSTPLVVGVERALAAPSSSVVSVGERGLVEISSFGSSDVEARLIDGEGRVVVKSDDRPDDWNFHLAARLEPGRYTLAIAPVGTSYGQTQVSVRAREEVVQGSLQLPVKQRAAVGRKVHVYPLAILDSARFLAVVARSSETLGLVLEEESDGVFRPLATSVGRPARIELPMMPGASKRKHRLKLWSADERNLPIDLVAIAVEPESIDEDDLDDGESVDRNADLPIAVAEVKLDRPGTFQVKGAVRWSSEPGMPAAAPVRGLIHPSGTRVWIVRDTGKRKSVEIAGQRVVLEDRALDFELGARPVDVDLDGEGVMLVRVEAAKALPGVCVVERSAPRGARPSCWDVNGRGAVSVHLDAHDAIARVWAAEKIAGPIDATVRMNRFAKPKVVTALQGTIPSGTAVALQLSAERKRLSVALEEGAVAVLSDGASLQRVAWASGEIEIFEGAGKDLTLLNPTEREATYSIEVLPLASSNEVASHLAKPYERRTVRAGRIELAVPAGAVDRRLFLRGGDAVLIDADGMVHHGERFLLGSSAGSLRVRHGVGTLMAWIDPPGKPGAGLFTATRAVETAASIPSAVALGGASQALRFASDRAQLVHVRVDAPMLARWEKDGAPAGEVLIREAGGTFDLHLPKGRALLSLRPIGGGVLFGSAEITATAVEALGEGLGPEVMIAPGAGRAFAFTMKQKGPIGIGVRSDAADVEAVLLSASGLEVGKGVVQMHELDAGTYLLHLFAPAGSKPARARPALVGLDAPPDGPPAETVQTYLRAAGYRER